MSGLGLLAAATVVVDLLAMYVLPEKSEYMKYKYTSTVDFSDFREGLATPVEEKAPLNNGYVLH